MKEQNLEKRFVFEVEKAGGKAWKFTSPGRAGVPDRLVLVPGGRVAFAELKAPGKKPTPLQQRRHQELHALGLGVYVIDSLEGIQAFVLEVFA